jgi:hypothetical protein
MRPRFLLLILSALLGCDLAEEPADTLHQDLSIPVDLALRAAHDAVGAGDTLRLYLDSPDTLRHCIVTWDDDSLGQFLLAPNPDSMWWRMPAGSVTDPRRVVLRARVSDGEDEWRDSVAVTVLEGRPGRVALLPVTGSRIAVQGRIAVVSPACADTTDRATVIDISNVLAPRIIATLPGGGGTGALQLDLPHLYLSSGFSIVDLTLPQSPWTIGGVDSLWFDASIAVGDRVLGTRGRDLTVLDVSDPLQWQVDLAYANYLSGSINAMWHRDGLIAARGPAPSPALPWESRVHVINTGGGLLPSLQETFQFTGEQGAPLGNLLIEQDRLFVPDGMLHVFTRADGFILEPLELSQAIPANFVFVTGENRLLCVHSSMLEHETLFQRVDIRELSEPTVLETGTLPDLFLVDAVLQGDFLYCLTNGGLQIIWAPAE